MAYHGLNSPLDYEENTMMVKPFSPDEAAKAALGQIPGFVIEAVNELIVENFGTGNNIIVLQDDIKARATKKC
jgi:hypothetical protein